MYVDPRDFRSGPMSKPKVVIIDYGVGNLLSVKRAIEECDAEPIISSEPNVITHADRVILPGVGAFANGMRALESLGLVEVIKAIAAARVPLLGICLGMQLLFDESEEHGLTRGIGIIPGRVISVPSFGSDGTRLKMPHIGWGELIPSGNTSWNETILQDLTRGDPLYFLHSFMAEPRSQQMRIADCLYGGKPIPAVIHNGNTYGCQFHPEKSGKKGIKILKRFCSDSSLKNSISGKIQL